MSRTIAMLALLASCGPDLGDPQPEQRRCEIDEPTRLLPNVSFAVVAPVAERWNVIGIRERDAPVRDSSTSLPKATFLVDPCGVDEPIRYAEGPAHPAGAGWISCSEGTVLWTDDASTSWTELPSRASCSTVDAHHGGLWLVDGHRLVHYATPDDDPEVVADDIDPRAGGGEYLPFPTQMRPYAIVRDTVFYIDRDGRLWRLDGPQRRRARVAPRARRLFTDPWGRFVGWEHDTRSAPGQATTLLFLGNGERVELPGVLDSLWFHDYVTTFDFNLAAVYDIGAHQLHSYFGAGDPHVIRVVDGYAYVVVQFSWVDLRGDVELLDLKTGATRRLARRIGPQMAAFPDPYGDGILVCAGEHGMGDLLRIDRSSSKFEVLAEAIRCLYDVNRDGDVLHLSLPPGRDIAQGWQVRLRDASGHDRIVAGHGWFNSRLDRALPPRPDLVRVDTQGDVLYTVTSGRDRGLWRMPFDRD